MVRCSNGHENPDGALFCNVCGSSIAVPTEASGVPAAGPPRLPPAGPPPPPSTAPISAPHGYDENHNEALVRQRSQSGVSLATRKETSSHRRKH